MTSAGLPCIPLGGLLRLRGRVCEAAGLAGGRVVLAEAQRRTGGGGRGAARVQPRRREPAQGVQPSGFTGEQVL